MKKYFKPKNSWQKVSKWYGKITEGEGHYYHKNIIIPNVLKLLNLNNNSKVLDLGCGSGILGRSIGDDVSYTGIDLSSSLINEAKRQDRSKKHAYIVSDASDLENLPSDFTDAVFILSLQNMKNAGSAIKNACSKLKRNGRLLLVLNHPSFRIPRQSSWEIDSKNKMEYRRVNKYMSELEIPINMNPGNRNSEFTWSYHFPISKITKMIFDSNLLIQKIEEWVSDKESKGSTARMENRARNEFPLFMAILAVKKTD